MQVFNANPIRPILTSWFSLLQNEIDNNNYYYGEGEQNNNGQQQAEMNPMCDNLAERAGRCDRDSEFSSFDKFWLDVVNYYDDDNQNNQNNGNQNVQNGNYYNVYQNGEYFYRGQNTCDFVDDLKHTPATWNTIKKAANRRGLSTGALACLIVAGVSVAAFLTFVFVDRICRRRMFCAEREPFLDQTEYQRSKDAVEA